MTDEETVSGAPAAAVREAFQDGAALCGADGFAGTVDGHLVRDVLGREPLFVVESAGGVEWATSLDDLDREEGTEFPAGHALATEEGNVNPLRDARRVFELPDPRPLDDVATSSRRVRAVLRSVAGDVPDDVPVAFSGGVDSGVVAAMTDGPLYVVGFPESHDLAAAREAAAAMDRELRVVELSHDRLRETVQRVARATGRTNAMDVAIAVPLVVAAEAAAADGHAHLAVGQGADELFGGYAKVANAPEDSRVAADTVRGATREVVQTLPGQLARDVPALRSAGVEPVAPFLRDHVVATALRLPGAALVDGDRRKMALREAARAFVPTTVADRDKKAVQYGSYASRELDRLARRAGFKRRMNDHVSRYVQSLVEE